MVKKMCKNLDKWIELTERNSEPYTCVNVGQIFCCCFYRERSKMVKKKGVCPI